MRQVTAHTTDPWGASMSDFINNANWTRQYEGTNPRTGEPMAVGNWYTPSGASAATTNNMSISDIFANIRDMVPQWRQGGDILNISNYGDYGPERFNPGSYPGTSGGPGAPLRDERSKAEWLRNSVGVEPIDPVPTGPEYHQGFPEPTWQDTAKQYGRDAWDFATENVGAGIDNARGAIDDFTAWDKTPEGIAWAKKLADATNVHDQLVSVQDAARRKAGSIAEGDGIAAWMAEKYNNLDDFSRFLKSQAEEVRIPVPGSENLKFDDTEKAMMKSIPGGGAPYAVMKYIYGLGGDSFDKLRGFWN